MKDDSLNDTQQAKGGYYPMCDTVYDRPHECVGKQMQKAQDEMDKAVKNYGRLDFESKLVCEVWNEAIEAAALKCIALSEQDDWSPGYKRSAQVIASKLKELRK